MRPAYLPITYEWERYYKIYAESFQGSDHLRRILEKAQTIVSAALAPAQRKEDQP